MSPPQKPARWQGRGVDAVLLVLAIAGVVAYARLLPEQLPDSAATSEVTAEEASERAELLLRENGYRPGVDLARSAKLVRDEALLDSLQRAHGRAETVELLRAEPEGTLPAFFWEVSWRRGDEDDDSPDHRVRLSRSGELYAVDAAAAERPVRRLSRRALAALLAPRPDGAATLAGIADSTLNGALHFDLTGSGPFSGEDVDSSRATALLEALVAGGPVALGPPEAARLAHHYVARSALRGADLQVDSVKASNRPGTDAALVYLSSRTPYYGQEVAVRTEVAATGLLLELEPTFNPDVAREEEEEVSASGDGFSVSIDGEDVADVVTGVLYAVLILGMLFMFMRRLNARVVDTKSALRDACWAGLFAGGLILVTSAPSIFASIDEFWIAFVILSVNVSIAGAGGAFVIFLASGATDSLARSVWPEKVETFSLLRHGALRNRLVGAALLRGCGLAFVIAGGIAVLLALFPGILLTYRGSDDPVTPAFALATFGYALTKNAWWSLFLGYAVLLGAGSMLYRWRRSAVLATVGTAVLLMLLQTVPFDLQPVGLLYVVAGFAALVVAWSFWQFDLLTAFVAFFLFGLLWDVQNGWLIEGSPLALDALLTQLLLGLVVVVGLVGALSRRGADELPSYVPSYIHELAHEERIKREFDLAYQVQASLLPRKTPRIDGVDIAAMCLPALEIGGDYYDFVELRPGRIAVVVGDVSGKGIRAAFYMTLVKGFVQTLCRIVDSPAEVLRRVNALFCENVPRGTFISMIYGVLDVTEGTFTFARAGHNPVILKRGPSDRAEMVRPQGMAIGLAKGRRFDEGIREEVVRVKKGDVLVLYTDGFSEAMNAHRELYGDLRLADRVREVGVRSASEILRAVSEDVHHFMEASGRHDDMTLLVLKMADPSARAAAGAHSAEAVVSSNVVLQAPSP